jgi:hypothetical protein
MAHALQETGAVLTGRMTSMSVAGGFFGSQFHGRSVMLGLLLHCLQRLNRICRLPGDVGADA